MSEVGEADLRAGRREWIGLAVVCLPTLLMSLDVSVLYLALPHLSSDLGADATQQLWIMDIYEFMIAGFLVTMGTLGDRIGRRRLLMIGGAGFGIASLLCAYSTSVEMLIASRALLGIFAATLTPSTLALLSNMFKNPAQRGGAIGIWFSCFMGGMTVGPLIGGALLNSFWWGSVFLLGAPVMVILLISAPILLPEYRNPQAGRVDLFSVALSLAALLPFIYGLKVMAKDGFATTPAIAVLLGLVFAFWFVRRQTALTDPLLDLRLFKSRAFSASTTLLLLMGIIMAGTSLLSALYLQLVLGLSPLEAGLWLLPQNIALVAISIAAPHVARRFRHAHVIAAGQAIAAVGFILISQVDSEGGLPLLIAGAVCTSAGVSFGMPLMTDLMVGSAPPEKAGSAASMMQTCGELGVALGVAMLGSLATLVYRGQLDGKLPDGVPGNLADTAQQSLTDAVQAAQSLGGTVGAELLDLARSAFTTGLNVVGVVGAVTFVAMAVMAVTLLRQPAPAGGSAPSEEPTPATAE